MKPLRLLLVEDSENDAALLIEYLRHGGYEPEYIRVDSAKALSEALDRSDWDLIIADYTMPGFSGTGACRWFGIAASSCRSFSCRDRSVKRSPSTR